MLPTFLLISMAHAGVTPAPSDVGISLELHDDRLDEGEKLSFQVTFTNGGRAPIRVAPPLDGSLEHMREPRWTLEVLDEDGEVVPAALGHGDEGRCGLTNPLMPEDVHRVRAGGSWTLQSEAMVWMPPQQVLASARPGHWRIRVRYEVTAGDGLTPLSLVSEPVALEIVVGDEALWQCRHDQLASRDAPVTVAGVHVVPADGGGFHAVHDIRTEGHVDRLLVQRLTDDLKPATKPAPLAEGPDLGWVDVVPGPLVAHTPALGDGLRAVRAADADLATTSGYLVAAARAGERVAVAWGDSNGLFVQLVGGAPVPLTGPDDGYAGFPTLVSDGSGFLAVWEAGAGNGRAQRLDADLSPIGERLAFELDGQTIAAARSLPDGLEIVYADSGYQGDDPADQMGLYRVRVPGGVPEALSEVDRDVARFGVGAWLDDGAFVRVFEEEGRLYLGAEARPAELLTDTGAGPSIHAAGDRFVVSWSDWRDDTSVACTELSECSGEGYAAVVGRDGTVLVGPSRITHAATPHPAAPVRDWERFCR